MQNKKNISVIIPAYNSKKTIRQCLNSLRSQDYKYEFEIILVDSSEDGTDTIVRHEFPEVKLIHLPVKTHPGKARYLGVKNSTGDLLLFIDSDCTAPENWVSKHVIFHRQYPEVAAIGGAVINGHDPKKLTAWAGYIAEFREFIPQQPKGFVEHAPTLNISYKRWVFEKYDGFDNGFYPQEDLVFNYKLINAGEKILFEPEIVVSHFHNPSFKAFLKHQKRIGEITATVLKFLPLSGAKIVRNTLLFFVALPFLPVVKFTRTLYVFLRRSPNTILKHPGAIVLFAAGLVSWTLGFTIGALGENKVN